MLLNLIKQFFNWMRACTKYLHQNIYDERLEYYNQYEAYKAVNLTLRKEILELEEKNYKLVKQNENSIQQKSNR